MADCGGATTLADDDRTYEVHRLAEGVDLYRDAFSWTPFLTVGHAYAADHALTQMHQAAATYIFPARTAALLVPGFSIFSSDDPLIQMQYYIDTRPGLTCYVAQQPWREDVTRILLTFHAQFQPLLKDLAALWTHND